MTNPNGSTGPTTESGKERSSRNATKHGLFSAADFVPDSEAAEYTNTFTALISQLSPEGLLEETFASEIMTATWRLRRCRLLENDASEFSPEQKSIDRARAQSHSILRRSLAELRKLQTERTVRAQLDSLDVPGLADTKQVLATLALNDQQKLSARKAEGTGSLEGLLARADQNLGMTPPESSFCKPDTSSCKPESSFCKTTPRNATCPCGSGTKYKRCCGTGAPPVLHMAA